jgi:hypothetical protein
VRAESSSPSRRTRASVIEPTLPTTVTRVAKNRGCGTSGSEPNAYASTVTTDTKPANIASSNTLRTSISDRHRMRTMPTTCP